jgi:large subunit ribosomal protein L17
MRHGKKVNHLSRKSEHRKAMMANMATSLIMHKRITTTVAKAKALRKYVEPLITRAKDDSTTSRRLVFSYLKKKEPIKELFSNVADKIADRPGGYTRILKIGTRPGDNAETCIIELVDFNETYTLKTAKKATRRRTRRGGVGKQVEETPKAAVAPKTKGKTTAKKEEASDTVAIAETPVQVVQDAVAVETVAQETVVEETTIDEVADIVPEEPATDISNIEEAPETPPEEEENKA